MKFKKGNIVKLIQNDYTSSNNIGDVGIITKCKNHYTFNSYKVEVKGNSNSCNWSVEQDLELVLDTPKKKTLKQRIFKNLKKQGFDVNMDKFQIIVPIG